VSLFDLPEVNKSLFVMNDVFDREVGSGEERVESEADTVEMLAAPASEADTVEAPSEADTIKVHPRTASSDVHTRGEASPVSEADTVDMATTSKKEGQDGLKTRVSFRLDKQDEAVQSTDEPKEQLRQDLEDSAVMTSNESSLLSSSTLPIEASTSKVADISMSPKKESNRSVISLNSVVIEDADDDAFGTMLISEDENPPSAVKVEGADGVTKGLEESHDAHGVDSKVNLAEETHDSKVEESSHPTLKDEPVFPRSLAETVAPPPLVAQTAVGAVPPKVTTSFSAKMAVYRSPYGAASGERPGAVQQSSTNSSLPPRVGLTLKQEHVVVTSSTTSSVTPVASSVVAPHRVLDRESSSQPVRRSDVADPARHAHSPRLPSALENPSPSSSSSYASRDRLRSRSWGRESGSQILIKNLPNHVTYRDLTSHYRTFGRVTDAVIRSTGHAFISFESAAEALRAVSATDKKTVFGNVLDVQLDDALPRVSTGGHRSYRKYGKVRIRNFSSGRYGCREDLKNLFRHYGPVRDCRVYEDGTAYVIMYSEDAREAVKNHDGMRYCGRSLEMYWDYHYD